MRNFIKVAMTAAALAAAPAAQAAQVITLSFDTLGSGQRITGFQTTGEPITVTLQAATVSIALTQLSDDFYEGFTMGNPVRATFTPTGLTIAGALNAGYTVGVAGSLSCYTGAAEAGAYSYGATGCGSLSYSIGSSIGFAENYTGRITNFRIETGDTTGSLGYSITSIIPEPASWALMLTGFMLTGYALRRRRLAFA
ncbi:hypothetical protein QE361_000008 [Sphingomonas sp. SORGH_AS802]|uniref:PEPxxWA-CTERM sorting domain-containing protein n=1 Tax=Sphingomonas sp. SORGH_AS_0802 TaxID=3041800 RepID=UPI00285A2297|nr:PEPxxWA-CTERM sorting domain-containing protein [Sphingomonas sp. SORGH_AS_0802]MDR6133050.1 hypothetical protein [Sphingomonas sp. SORGH_AS_0802]